MDIYQIRKIQILRALDLGAVLDVDDARTQHDTAVGVDLPADVNSALNDSFIISFHSGIGAVFDLINGSQSNISSRSLCIIKLVKSLWCRHDARELPRIDDAGRPHRNTVGT